VPNFTVAELAARIRRKGEKFELVADRIRNWTKDGLLEPTGDKNPGTGRSRLYPEKALIEAMVLLELMDCLGIQPIKARYYAGWFKAAKQVLERDAKQKRYLVFSRGLEEDLIRTTTGKELAANLQGSEITSHVVIDIGNLYARIQENPETA
jgi:hypothetical protein